MTATSLINTSSSMLLSRRTLSSMTKHTLRVRGGDTLTSTSSLLTPSEAATATTAATNMIQKFDLTRAMMRTEALSTYSVIAALLIISSVSIYNATPKKMKQNHEKKSKIENYATSLFMFANILGVLSGLSTTIIFSLSGLYSKTALGLGNEIIFLEFLHSTMNVRKFGFKCMVTSLVTFKLCFVLSIFLNFKGKIGGIVSGIAALAAFLSSLKWMSVIQKASFIFR